MSPKAITAKRIRQFIEKTYALSLSKEPIEEGEGIENAAWMLATSDGNFIVKVFEYETGIYPLVKEEVILYEYLLGKNIHVPEVLETRSGEKVAKLQDFPVILMKYEDLKRYKASDLSEEQLEKIATTIASMHLTLKNYVRREQLPVSPHDNAFNHSFSSADFEKFLTSPNAKSSHLSEHEKLRKIWHSAITFLSQKSLSEGLTLSVLHSDLALGHIRFLPSEEPYIFDFSDFSYGPVAADLGVLFFNFYREGEITMSEWRKMTSHFLSIYTNIFPLTDGDQEAITLFTVSRLLSHIRYLNNISNERNRLVDDTGIRKRYDLLEELYLANL